MVDRVAATITIGGALPFYLLDAFVGLVEDEALAPEWDGEPFTVAGLPADGPLMLIASEVAWGEFRELESFCVAHRLPFARWHQSNCASWGAERAVFTGENEVRVYAATDDDTVMIDRETVVRLGLVEAILDYLEAADLDPPHFQVVPARAAS
jgi:hypothetical protein